MRVDLFLKTTRLIKRRSIAKEYCERSLVLINGKEAKPSSEVKEGDKLEITFGEKKVYVLARIVMMGNKERGDYERL